MRIICTTSTFSDGRWFLKVQLARRTVDVVTVNGQEKGAYIYYEPHIILRIREDHEYIYTYIN